MKRTIWLAAVVGVGLLFVGVLTGCYPWDHHEEHSTGTEHPTAREEHHEHPGTSHEAEHPTEQPAGGEHPTATEEHPSGAEHPSGWHRDPATHGGTVLARFESRGRLVARAEHPAEHPAEPRKRRPMPERKPLTVQDVANGIERYIKRDTRLKGGYFLFYDEKQEKPLVLKLDKVHRERLAKTAEHTFFACSDFVAPMEDGKLYDLDFWIKEKETGQMTVTEIMVHKEAGEPRYTWHQVGGTWKRRPVD